MKNKTITIKKNQIWQELGTSPVTKNFIKIVAILTYSKEVQFQIVKKDPHGDWIETLEKHSTTSFERFAGDAPSYKLVV